MRLRLKSIRSVTAMNLADFPPDIAEAIPLLRLASTDELRLVRHLAGQAICRLLVDQLDGLRPFETAIKGDLSDLATLRLVLWAYYPRQSEPSVRRGRQALILRTIEEMPRHDIPEPPLVQLHPGRDRECYP